jgi:predicted PurR-regulated permease PerM
MSSGGRHRDRGLGGGRVSGMSLYDGGFSSQRDAGFQPVIALATLVLVVACLYWAQAVLIPIAVAVLLTFLLSPVVRTLHRRGLGQVPAVLVVVVLALLVLGGVGWVLTRQLLTLADELPRYSLNIRQRIADLRGVGKGGSMEKVQETVQEVVSEIQKTDAPGAPRQQPVAVVLEPSSVLVHLPSLLKVLASAGIVTVL